jgi:hypothetical protein
MVYVYKQMWYMHLHVIAQLPFCSMRVKVIYVCMYHQKSYMYLCIINSSTHALSRCNMEYIYIYIYI